MLSFNMSAHRITVDPMTLSLDFLMQIYKEDTHSLKENAIKRLTYIHICSQLDPSAPFYKSDPGDVASLCKKEIYGDYSYVFEGDMDEKFMDECILKYQAAYDTPEEKAVRTINKKIHQITESIDKTEIVVKEVMVKGTPTYISNFPILDKMMQNIGKICKARDELKASIARESKGEVKANRKLSYLEKRSTSVRKSRREKIKDESMDGEEMKKESEVDF